MSTITVFVADTEEEERRRRRAKRLAAVIILGIAGVFGFSQEDTPIATPSSVAIAPAKPDLSESRDSDHYGTPIGPLPGPRAIVAPATLDFGKRALESIGPAQLVTIRNDGGHPLVRVTTSISGPFAVTSGCPDPITPGGDCTAAVVFAPRAPGASYGELTIHAGNDRRTVRLTGRVSESRVSDLTDIDDDGDDDGNGDRNSDGNGDDPESGHPHHLCINPTSIHFVRSGLDAITLTNPDDAPIQVTSIRLSGRGGGPAQGYEIAGDACVKTIAPGEQCRFTILASPLAVSTREQISVEVRYDVAERQRMVAAAVAIAETPSVNRR